MPDTESPIRKMWIDEHAEYFHVEEEVEVFSALWMKRLRVDILATPKSEFSELSFAIECKNPAYWKIKTFAESFAQCSHYNYCVISDKKSSFKGRVINSSFLFIHPTLPIEREREQIEGARHLASQLRVGTSSISKYQTPYVRQSLHMRNEFWTSHEGFNNHAKGILTGKRPFGSSKVVWRDFEERIFQAYSSNGG